MEDKHNWKAYTIKLFVDMKDKEAFEYKEDLEPIHDILAGNPDYFDSNIVYNIDEGPLLWVFMNDLRSRDMSIEQLKSIIDMIASKHNS